MIVKFAVRAISKGKSVLGCEKLMVGIVKGSSSKKPLRSPILFFFRSKSDRLFGLGFRKSLFSNLKLWFFGELSLGQGLEHLPNWLMLSEKVSSADFGLTVCFRSEILVSKRVQKFGAVSTFEGQVVDLTV